MVTALERLLPGQRMELTRDPVKVLQEWREIIFRTVPAAETGSRCSVAGAYYAAEDPPVIVVANATSSGRRAFTALHELGHHLQQSDFDLAEAVDAYGSESAQFEDAACDAFAAEVLLPESLVSVHLPEEGPSAADVMSLWRDCSASRAAVCVRVAQRLRSPGHVVLLGDDGTVFFAAAHGLPPIARDSDQSDVSVVRRALVDRSRRTTGRARFRYRNGIEGQELYAQAADLDGPLIVIAVTDHPVWELGFTPPSADIGPWVPTRVCEHLGCGHEFRPAGLPCSRCGNPECPECGRCGCTTRVREAQCPKCFTVYPQHYFEGEVCRDCA